MCKMHFGDLLKRIIDRFERDRAIRISGKAISCHSNFCNQQIIIIIIISQLFNRATAPTPFKSRVIVKRAL